MKACGVDREHEPRPVCLSVGMARVTFLARLFRTGGDGVLAPCPPACPAQFTNPGRLVLGRVRRRGVSVSPCVWKSAGGQAPRPFHLPTAKFQKLAIGAAFEGERSRPETIGSLHAPGRDVHYRRSRRAQDQVGLNSDGRDDLLSLLHRRDAKMVFDDFYCGGTLQRDHARMV